MTLNLLDFDIQINLGKVHRLIPYSISISDFCLLFGAMPQNYMYCNVKKKQKKQKISFFLDHSVLRISVQYINICSGKAAMN